MTDQPCDEGRGRGGEDGPERGVAQDAPLQPRAVQGAPASRATGVIGEGAPRSPTGAPATSPAAPSTSPSLSPYATPSNPNPYWPRGEPEFWPDGQVKVFVPFRVASELEEEARRGERLEREKRRREERGGSGGLRGSGSSRRTDGSHDPAGGPDAVGYGRPPREHRFAPGQSGNPKGRPKGSKNKPPKDWRGRLLEIAQAEAFCEIPIREGDATVRVPLVQAVLRSAGVSALKGKVGAQWLVLDVAREAEETVDRERQEADRDRQEFFELAFQRKEEGRAEVARRKAQVAAGLVEAVDEDNPSNLAYADDLLPHPDDLLLDPVAGEVRFAGPIAHDQREAWHAMLTVRDGFTEHIKVLEDMQEASSDPDQRAALEEGLKTSRRWLSKFRSNMPPWVDRRVNKDPPSLEEVIRAVRYLEAYLPPEP